MSRGEFGNGYQPGRPKEGAGLQVFWARSQKKGENMADLKIKEIKTLDYERPDIYKGYANQYLSIDLGGYRDGHKQTTNLT